MKTLIVNFSGGRSSGRMVSHIEHSPMYAEYKKVYIFCNTGCEHEDTLKFVDQVDNYFGLNLIWLEGVTINQPNVGIKHKVVSYETASKKGEPYEAMIAKHGIPNMNGAHCTRELKTYTTISYLRSLGLRNKDIVMAMGFRADERKRMKNNPTIKEVYPLITMDIDKTDVLMWWENMPFDLEIEEHQGNCVWCWKKSDAKHFLNIQENPHFYDFPLEMDKKYGEVIVSTNEKRRTFFRNYRQTKVLKGQAEIMAIDTEDLKKIIKNEISSSCTDECSADYIEIDLDSDNVAA